MEIKDRIIEHAEKLFMRYGVKSVTMDDIASDLAISKKTIYQYFKDKDDIVLAATKNHIDEERKEFEEIYVTSENAIEEIFRVSKCLRKNVRNINPVLLHDLNRYHSNAWNQWLEFKDDFIFNSIRMNLKKGIQQGFFRNEINVDIMSRLRLMQVQMSFDPDVFPLDQYDLYEVQTQLFDLFLYGILTHKGKDLYHQYLEQEKLQKA